jgi:hypothetical protein
VVLLIPAALFVPGAAGVVIALALHALRHERADRRPPAG